LAQNFLQPADMGLSIAYILWMAPIHQLRGKSQGKSVRRIEFRPCILSPDVRREFLV
jgi:hypothetical protein